ncbi:MAG: FGGY family carbohydrate kinase [Nakamurella sp.]
MNVVGLDLGTSQVKAVLFDDQWRVVAEATETTVVQQFADGRSEQDMREVWAAARRVLSQVRADHPVDAIAVTAQGDGCWLVDQQGSPVGPALLWNDNRAAPLIDEWERAGVLDSAFAITGCYGAPGLAHGQLRWLRANDPERVQRATHLLSCGSWIFHCLTGRRALDVSDAANPFLDTRTRQLSSEAFELYGIPELQRLIPDIVDSGDRSAGLSAEAATATGIAAGTPVVLAPYDVVATATGSATIDPGQAFAILGTTLCVAAVASDPVLDRPPNGMTLPGIDPGRWLITYATLAGTEVLHWTARLLGLDGPTSLIRLAATATPGDGPHMTPYLSPSGERSPFRDSAVRGSLRGLTLRHTPADVALASLDALTLAVRDCLEATGTRPDSIRLSGGGARSAPWCQMISDATRTVVTGPDTTEVGARGAAITAVAELDRERDVSAVCREAVGSGREYSPHEQSAARYDSAFVTFRDDR